MNKTIKRLLIAAVLVLAIVLIIKMLSKSGEKQGIASYQSIDSLEIPLIAKGEEIVSHKGYVLSYSEPNEQAKWVAYVLTSEELSGKKMKRTDDFREDPTVPTGSATPEDYFHSGYDRGHLAPAADMKWSPEVQSESFYMSNMSPQAPSFNRGIWNKLEEHVRDWAKKFGKLYIVTGPVLKGEMKKIGNNKVSVPPYYYKVLLRKDEQGYYHATAFLLPNDNLKDSPSNYEVSVDSVEHFTGIDFFYRLPDKVENEVESKVERNEWSFGRY